MSKALKWSIFALILIAIGVVLSHGVIVPRFLWEPRLQTIQNQYPDQTIQVKRVVLALSLKPQLIISEIEIDAPNRQENVKIALLRFGMDAIESVQQGRLQIKAIAVKGLAVDASRQADCGSISLSCIPVLPVALVARGWASTQVANPGFFTPELALNTLELEQAQFTVNNPEAQQVLSGKLEQFKFKVGNSTPDNQFNLGWRVGIKTPQENNELYIAMNAQTEAGPMREVSLKQLKVDIDGQWNGFPWTGSAEQDLLVLRLAQTNNGEGAPFIKLNGENLRTYVRRDDLPETHQAAFSAQQFEGGLPAQNWTLNKAEWTYTHEDAQAWTFNMNYAASEGLLELQPETIRGSEGIPAEAQVRELNCDADETAIREDQPYWAWQEGWFRVLNQHPQENSSLVLCPVQQPSVGAGLDAAAEAAGK
ncbi:hypothetical protein [Limnobacter sp. MED105]|uniref:hypothetical protein n=1 Tax=Limnobacter sp. MED105 TaxID=391597 RepID=UPI000156C7F1|nr:hypothetical protein [Limnobacter sp. MED105]EDM85081.1 hypothetical protein LMED105_06012 [Limnobacter sp. MED105]